MTILDSRQNFTIQQKHGASDGMNLAQSSAYIMFVFGGHNRKMSSYAYSFRSMPTMPTARIPRDVLASGEIKVDSWFSYSTNIYQEISHLVILTNFLKTS
jgi:hypothetical protein